MSGSGPGVGFVLPARKVSWLKRDTLLFNVSIGCRADEPHFLYELNNKFSPFPTFPLGLVFKLDSQEVVDFYAAQTSVAIPGAPVLNPAHLVDGLRLIQVLKPLPVTSAGRNFEFRSTVLGVFDKGKAGTVVKSEDALVDADSGEVYARNIGSVFYVGQGVWGGPRGPKEPSFPPPEGRSPDGVLSLDVGQESAHLYRLNGDYNPLHGTPEPGREMGYGGIILHGVYAYNRIAHDLLRELGQSDPANFREFQARFSGPVKPGDTVRTEFWYSGEPDSNGWQEIRWLAKVGSGQTCLSDGRAVIRTRGGFVAPNKL